MKEQSGEVPEFTDEIIDSLFCNIDDLCDMHIKIVKDLDAAVNATNGYDWTNELGKVFLAHVSFFFIRFQPSEATGRDRIVVWPFHFLLALRACVKIKK